MIVHKRRRIIDKLINNLPFELHIPSYQYCGPGTALEKRLARGDPGINKLDIACKNHDLAYQSNQVGTRQSADRALIEQAWQRVVDKDASLREKAAAYLVTNLMKLKSKLGMGLAGGKKKKKKINLKSIIRLIRKRMLVPKNNSSKSIIQSALKAARASVKQAGGKRNVIIPRMLPVSTKMGGFLPTALIPVFAGLSAIGSLAGGAAGIVNAVNKANRDPDTHLGKGLYLRSHRRGLGIHTGGEGLYLKPWKKGFGLRKKKKLQITKKAIN